MAADTPRITTSGLGSGLNVNSIVEQLVAVERGPAEQRLTIREVRFQSKLSSYGLLKSAISEFQSSFDKLGSAGNYLRTSASADNLDMVLPSATGAASVGEYKIKVAELAVAHSIATSAFADADTVVGTGTLTFKFGEVVSGEPDTFELNEDKNIATVKITAANNTLEGIRDAVNDANIGVNVSIINDGSGFLLVFTSTDSGVENSMLVTVEEDGDEPTNTDTDGLSMLAYDPLATVDDGLNMEQKQAAVDAEFSINGVTVISASNVVTDAVEGLTLTLRDTDPDLVTTVTISKKTNAITDNVNKFISSYNSMRETMNSLTSYDADKKRGSSLIGDSLVRNIDSRLRQLVGSEVEGILGNYRSLSDIGISFSRDGSLSLNVTRFNNALDDDPDAVARIFTETGSTSDNDIKYVSATDETKVGNHSVVITQQATQGSFTGTAIAGYAGSIDITDNNNTLVIKIDGIRSNTITLTQRTGVSGESLAKELQSRINGDGKLSDAGVSVTVAFDGDRFIITSEAYGSNSSVEITSISNGSDTKLGLDVALGDDGVDVEGTINGLIAEGDGLLLTGLGSISAGLIVESKAVVGDAAVIGYSRGLIYELNKYLDGVIAENGVIDNRTDVVKLNLDLIDEQRVDLDKRIVSFEARMRKQFTALDILLASLNSSGQFLLSQLDNLPEIGGFLKR